VLILKRCHAADGDADKNLDMSALNRALKYGVFATIATLINLSTQELAIRLYSGPFDIYVALLLGTVTGLVSKYTLDKRYIFAYATKSHRHNLNKFLAYTFTGGFTTAVFWGLELGFEYWFGGKIARYTGAVIGLSIGYVVKYRLDKHLVFARAADSASHSLSSPTTET
jgi:putative flippase GtrA